MLAKQTYPFVGGPAQPRADRIDEAEWERHKSEIIREYLALGLPHAREYMKTNHLFVAKLGQYRYRIHTVWGIKKRDCGVNSDPVQSISSCIETVSLNLNTSFPDSIGNELDNDPKEGAPCSSAKKDNVELKSVNLTCQPEDEILSSENCIETRQNLKRTASLLSEASPTDEKRQKSTPSEICLDNTQGQICKDSHQQSSDGTADAAHQNIKEATMSGLIHPSQSPEELENAAGILFSLSHLPLFSLYADFTRNDREHSRLLHSATIGAQERLVIDIACSVDLYSSKDINIIKAAADLLFSLSSFRDCFRLYILVWKRLVASRNASRSAGVSIMDCEAVRNAQRSWTEQMVLINCVRSAVTPVDLDIAEGLVRQELGSRHYQPMDMLMHHILLSEIRSRQADENAAIELLSCASRVFLDADAFLYGHVQQNTAVSLLTFKYLHASFAHRAVTFEAEMNETLGQYHAFKDMSAKVSEYLTQLLHRHFLADCGSPLSVEFGFMKNGCVRNCLNWCIFQTQSRISLVAMSMKYMTKLLDQDWGEFKTVYCFLYNKWIEGNNQPLSSARNAWADEVETTMGISAAELLAIMVQTVLWTSKQPNGSNSLHTPVWSPTKPGISIFNLLNRFNLVAASLSNSTDEDLAGALISNFRNDNHLNYDLTRNKFSKRHRQRLLKYAESCLNVQLPAINHQEKEGHGADPTSTTQVTDADQRGKSGDLFVYHNPTLALSFHSSGWSSFRRTGIRFVGSKAPSLSSISLRQSVLRRNSWISNWESMGTDVDDISERMSLLEFSQSDSQVESVVIDEQNT